MSKGSKRRPEDKKKIDSNWDKIFNNDKLEEKDNQLYKNHK
jgi:hypothetical protein